MPVAATRIHLANRRNDYINANLVTLNSRDYICTQAPLMETTNDFWLMLVQQNCRVIVMLTNLVEKNRIRCHKYWPSKQGETRRYGALSVQLVKSALMAGIILRKFRVIDSAGNNERHVTQIQYTEWPDFGVPDSCDGIRQVLDIFDHYISSSAGCGPVLVHCSGTL